MIRLVVDAAEFGRSAAINAEIVRAHREGIVTSTSVIGNAAGLPEAIATLATDAPGLGTGLALALVHGSPVTPAAAVGTLVGPAGTLRTQPRQLALDWMLGRIDRGQVETELEGQLTRARAAGLVIDHLCTVSHLGFLPGIGEIIERLARRHDVPGIRTDVEAPNLSWVVEPLRGLEVGVLGGLAWVTRRRLGMRRHGPKSWGYLESGRLDDVRILETIGRMGPGSHELMCTPVTASTPLRELEPGARGAGPSGHGRHDEAKGPPGGGPAGGPDLSALCAARVRNAVVERGIVLCRWRDIF